MKPNIGLKVLDSGKLALVHLATGEVLSGLQAVYVQDNQAGKRNATVTAKFGMFGIASVDSDYATPQDNKLADKS